MNAILSCRYYSLCMYVYSMYVYNVYFNKDQSINFNFLISSCIQCYWHSWQDPEGTVKILLQQFLNVHYTTLLPGTSITQWQCQSVQFRSISQEQKVLQVKFGRTVLHCAHNWQPNFWTVRKKVRVIHASLNFESAMIWWQSLLTRSAMDSVTAGFSRCRTATKWRWGFSRCH